MFNENFKLLEKEAFRMGYQSILISDTFPSNCNPYDNTVNISMTHGEINAIYEFAHELGHCQQFNKVFELLKQDKKLALDLYFKTDTKINFLIRETDAWIKGYSILKRNGIVSKGYFKHASFCLWLYIKFVLRN